MMKNFQRTMLLVVCLSGSITCRELVGPGHAAGRVIWSVPGQSFAAPAVVDSNVYFAGLSSHEVLALDVRTGTERWRVRTDEPSSASNPGRLVLATGGLVIVPDQVIYAFDGATGARRWTFRPTNGDLPGLQGGIATDGQLLFSGSPMGYAYALDVATGSLRWSVQVSTDGLSVVKYPVYADGLVFVSLLRNTNPATGGMVALDAATGRERWRRELVATDPQRGSAVRVRAGIWRDLVIATADDGTVYALRRADGSIAWTAPRLQGSSLDDRRPVAVVGDIVVVGSDRELLVGLNAETGEDRWRLPSAFGSVSYDMGSDNDYVYVVYASLQLSAIDAATGKIRWTSTDHDYETYPVSDGVRVFTPGYQGYYALMR